MTASASSPASMRSRSSATCSPRRAGRRPRAASRVDAWTIFLHADRPDEHQDCVTVNAFGDRYPADLCPANPDVRAYARALVADVCALRRRVDLRRVAPLPRARARPPPRALLHRARDEGPLPARPLLLRALPRRARRRRRRRRPRCRRRCATELERVFAGVATPCLGRGRARRCSRTWPTASSSRTSTCGRTP